MTTATNTSNHAVATVTAKRSVARTMVSLLKIILTNLRSWKNLIVCCEPNSTNIETNELTSLFTTLMRTPILVQICLKQRQKKEERMEGGAHPAEPAVGERHGRASWQQQVH
jgi:hypothetical protein